ncbi:hypothetical protein C8J57DRAFT_1249035 [Mycena rebaudengoi]|nr:hypothetical protein C8J57DRAFT_1249035 [Mycena rebaudengoi]
MAIRFKRRTAGTASYEQVARPIGGSAGTSSAKPSSRRRRRTKLAGCVRPSDSRHQHLHLLAARRSLISLARISLETAFTRELIRPAPRARAAFKHRGHGIARTEVPPISIDDIASCAQRKATAARERAAEVGGVVKSVWDMMWLRVLRDGRGRTKGHGAQLSSVVQALARRSRESTARGAAPRLPLLIPRSVPHPLRAPILTLMLSGARVRAAIRPPLTLVWRALQISASRENERRVGKAEWWSCGA